MTIADLQLQLKQIFIKFLLTFKNIPFDVRLKYLVWKYKGGQNIPIDELKKLKIIPTPEHEEALIRSVHMSSAVRELAAKYKLEWETLNFTVVLARFMTGELNDAAWHKVMEEIYESPRPRRLIYQEMVELGDLPGTPPAGEDAIGFGRWLDEDLSPQRRHDH